MERKEKDRLKEQNMITILSNLCRDEEKERLKKQHTITILSNQRLEKMNSQSELISNEA